MHSPEVDASSPRQGSFRHTGVRRAHRAIAQVDGEVEKIDGIAIPKTDVLGGLVSGGIQVEEFLEIGLS